MDSVIALQGNGFVIMAADCSSARSVLVFSHSEDKIHELDGHKLLGQAGPQCDTSNFAEYIQKNMTLYELNNETKLSTHATANFMRRELANALRQSPYQTNVLLGGFDAGAGASLYYIDNYASLSKLNYACHGYASSFCLSILDRTWKEGMTEPEARAAIQLCIDELKTRFLISQPKFAIKIVDAAGTRVLSSP